MVLSGLLIAGPSSRAAEDPAKLREELDSVRRELAGLQTNETLHSVERWRQRDRAEYEMPEIADIRVQVKAVEKSLVEKRAALRDRLTALYPELREPRRERDEAYARWSELRTQAGLIDNEVRLAERADPPEPEKLEALRAEQKKIREQALAAHEEAETARTGFLARQKELAQGDEQCAALQAEITELETRFQQMHRQMNEELDARPDIIRAEQQRKEQAERVRQLRQREQELIEQLSNSE